MTDLSEVNREKLRAEIELFKALHEIHYLRKENERLQLKNGELNEFLQPRATNGWGHHVIDVAMSHIEQQENEIEQLRATLKCIEGICEKSDQIRTNYDLVAIENAAYEALAGEKIDS